MAVSAGKKYVVTGGGTRKTDGVVTRPTMASGHGSGRNTRPRVSSPAGVTARAARREVTANAGKPGFKMPGSRNPRKVSRLPRDL